MSGENKVIAKGSTASFIEYNLAQLNMHLVDDSDHDKKLVKNGLLAIIDYASKNNEALNTYSAPSVLRTVETIKELKLNLALPNMAYIVVWNVGASKDVRVAPFKNGYREIFQNYGDNVKKIHAIWEVRKGDVFKAPKWVGINQTEAEYEQRTTYGRVEKVVVVYETLDGEIRYLFAERNNVIPSLIGIVRKYGGSNPTTNKIIDKIKELDDLDKAYEYVLENAPNLLSPAYKDHWETIAVTKMINFIVRNHPISDRKATPGIKKALEDVLDMEYEEVVRPKINDQKLDEEVNNGAIGSQEVVEKEETTETTEKANTSDDFVEKDEVVVVEEKDIVKEVVVNEPLKEQKKEEPPKDLFDGGNKADVKTDENGEVIEKTEQNVTETEKTDESTDEDDFAKFLQG